MKTSSQPECNPKQLTPGQLISCSVTYLKQWKVVFGINRNTWYGNVASMFKYYSPWLKSRLNLSAEGPVLDRVPWITFEARDFLESRLHKDMTVFEYGSGGSTLFFSDRVRQVISVENDANWANTMEQLLSREMICNVDLKLVEAEMLQDSTPTFPDDPAYCHSGSLNYNRFEFGRYVSVIDDFPDRSFDVILIDGRARVSCLHRSIPKVRHGGIIILDNSERSYYWKNMSQELGRWQKYIFYGPIPYLEHFTETTCWIRP